MNPRSAAQSAPKLASTTTDLSDIRLTKTGRSPQAPQGRSRSDATGHNQPVTSVRQISEKLPSTESSIIQK